MSIEAGRETDARVMIEVMGERALTPHEVAHGIRLNPPRYSTDRSAALEVVDRLIGAGLRTDLCGDLGGWTAAVLRGHHDLWEDDAPSLPLAICRCALHPDVLAALHAAQQQSNP